MNELIALVQQFGPWVAMVFFLVLNNRKDYTGLCKRLNAVEDAYKADLKKGQQRLATLLTEAISVIRHSNELHEQTNELYERLLDQVKKE